MVCVRLQVSCGDCSFEATLDAKMLNSSMASTIVAPLLKTYNNAQNAKTVSAKDVRSILINGVTRECCRIRTRAPCCSLDE